MDFIFPEILGVCHHPLIDEIIFFRGVGIQPPTRYIDLSWVMAAARYILCSRKFPFQCRGVLDQVGQRCLALGFSTYLAGAGKDYILI